MSFQPKVVTPEYALINGKTDFSHIRDYKFPENKREIARLSLAGKQVWYAAQDPHTLIEADADFGSFWYWRYILPLKLKRFLFSFKFW